MAVMSLPVLLADGIALHLVVVGGAVADRVEKLAPEHLAHQGDRRLSVSCPVLQYLQPFTE